MEITESKEQKEKRLKKNKQNVRDLWVNIKINILLVGVPGDEEKGRGRKNI